MLKKIGRIFALFFLVAAPAFADIGIETSVSSSRVAVGGEIELDIIITDAPGQISKPRVSSIEGFTSYSQGHSQEISIVNGQSSSRSIFTYVLVANSAGKKMIGPFEVDIDGRTYKVAPVEVEVVQSGAGLQGSTGYSQAGYSQAPASAPPARALPQGAVSSQDIFVKAWLDKDEAYINEPVMLTYTLYTRLSATYKGFEKEPVTTDFWVEDFPPEKTIRRTEQFFNGSRYVVADVRKLALFPTRAGVYTVEPGVLSSTVEIRDQNDFDSFFSYNVFGRRSAFPSPIAQIIQRPLNTDPVTLMVKALPEEGRPSDFTGAVGRYSIESSVDKTQTEEGSPVTFRVRVSGQGNINTVQMPTLPKMDGVKIYDASASSHVSKDRLIVEGDKTAETVVVPNKAGTVTIPALGFSYFDPAANAYRRLKTSDHTLVVKPGPENEPPSQADPSMPGKEEPAFFTKDIRYIKTAEGKDIFPRDFYKHPFYWPLNGFLALLSACLFFLSKWRDRTASDGRGFRFRRSHGVAMRRLKSARASMKEERRDEFYSGIAKAVYGYFADKLGIPSQSVGLEEIERGAVDGDVAPGLLSEIRALFDELALGRFARVEKSAEDMKETLRSAERVIAAFEKVKLK